MVQTQCLKLARKALYALAVPLVLFVFTLFFRQSLVLFPGLALDLDPFTSASRVGVAGTPGMSHHMELAIFTFRVWSDSLNNFALHISGCVCVSGAIRRVGMRRRE
jgi:hypothetical protein